MTKEDVQKWSKTFLLSASFLGFALFFYSLIQVSGLIIIQIILRNHSEALLKLIQILNIDPTSLSQSFSGFFQYLSLLISKTVIIVITSIIFWVTNKRNQKNKWFKFLSLIIAASLVGRLSYITIIGLLALIGSLLLVYEDTKISKI